MRKHELDKRFNSDETGVEVRGSHWSSRSRKRKAAGTGTAVNNDGNNDSNSNSNEPT